MKVYGTGIQKDEDGNELKLSYSIIMFPSEVGLQELFILWEEDDIYAPKVAERITASINPKTEVNGR